MIAMVIATPLGLGAAMYLSEYASPKTRRRLKPILETLAGIPSVVLGYFALQVINPTIVQNLFRRHEHLHDHGCRHRRGHPHDPARRLGRGGCDVRRARRRCGRRHTVSGRGDGR